MRQSSFSLVCLFCFCLSGCAGSFLSSKSIETAVESEYSDVDTPFVADMARPFGMSYQKVEAVSIVTGLAGTGGDPPQTPQRALLLTDMRRREIENPSHILASTDTALVLVKGYLRPGTQKGDRFDIEVRFPSRSDAKSLRGGWLLPVRMTEMAVLGHQIRSGHTLAAGEGAVLVDPTAQVSDAAILSKGRVLGGGIVRKSRSLGLVIDNEYQSVHTSQLLGASINRRFHTYRNGTERGVVTPKTDDFVELVVHPRYKDNIGRYMRVIQNIACRESATELANRMKLLDNQLADPLTAATAAIRLEAIGGDEAKAILRKGIDSKDIEVRFYASEALAYLDDTAAAETLAEIARTVPAFRLNALAALSAMDDPRSRDALKSLLSLKSAETRYGAFRALWSMDSNDPLVEGTVLEEQFRLHVLPVEGPPMIHATRSFRPEITLFGTEHKILTPFMVEAGKDIFIRSESEEAITVVKIAGNKPTQKRVIANDVEAMIRAIVELGGKYPDVVQALQEANEAGALASRFKVDAIPEPGRQYTRQPDEEESESTPEVRLATPLPGLFGGKH